MLVIAEITGGTQIICNIVSILHQNVYARRVALAMQLEGFIGTDAVLRGWEQKQALLLALRPRDRLRLLGLVRACPLRLPRHAHDWNPVLELICCDHPRWVHALDATAPVGVNSQLCCETRQAPKLCGHLLLMN